MGAGGALDTLIAGLRGHLAENAEWQPVIALANHTLVTPALFSSLAHNSQIDRLPNEVHQYLRFIHDCNQERNFRLRSQLCEAVAALNRRGIVPVLLKGAIPLFLSSASRLPSRMTSDLDVAVDATEVVAARACLGELGYVQVSGIRDLARPEDPAVLELRPSEVNGFELQELIQPDGLRVKIPSVESRALHWIVHDLLKEGDYWRGRVDLRHLHDLAQLAESSGVDWTALRASMPDESARNAFDTQLLTLNQFFGTEIPAECFHRPMIRFQHWRRVFTARHPVMGAPLRLAANFVWVTWRFSHAVNVGRPGPVRLARRTVRVLFDRDLRSKI